MTLNSFNAGQGDLKTRITVFGVGGSGNAVNNMIEKELDGVDFVWLPTRTRSVAKQASEEPRSAGLKC